MMKNDIRRLRGILWGLRGKYGSENVDFVLKVDEVSDPTGDPQEESYDIIVYEKLFIETPDGLSLIYENEFESLYGMNEDLSDKFKKVHLEVIKLSKYFRGTGYKSLIYYDGVVFEECIVPK